MTNQISLNTKNSLLNRAKTIFAEIDEGLKNLLKHEYFKNEDTRAIEMIVMEIFGVLTHEFRKGSKENFLFKKIIELIRLNGVA